MQPSKQAFGGMALADFLADPTQFEIYCDGQIAQLKQQHLAHAVCVRELFRLLYQHTLTYQAGEVFQMPVYANIQCDSVQMARIPDIAFYSQERFSAWKQSTNDYFSTVLSIPPDLTIEVISEIDSAHEIQQKVATDCCMGVSAIWLIDLTNHTAQQLLGDNTCNLEFTQTLSAPALLPHFQLVLKDLLAMYQAYNK